MHLPDGLVDDPFSILQTNFFRERYFLRRCLNKSLRTRTFWSASSLALQNVFALANELHLTVLSVSC